MMKRKWKKWTAFVLALIVMACTIILPAQKSVMAASKAYMKKVPVMWDLKQNKTITYRTKYSGLGMKKQKLKVTNWKIKDADEKGYKQLSFTATFRRQWNVTDKEIKDYVKAGSHGNMCWICVADYKTGKDLESQYDKNVTITNTDWKTIKTKTYQTRDKKYSMSLKDVRISYTIIYPKTYKDLCIGMGGMTSLDMMEIENKFGNGQALFGDTHLCSKKYKNIAHFIRVK